MNTAHRRHRILIVDDTPANIDLLGAILSDTYDISVAINGRTALAVAGGKWKPDLILLDIMMPEMDGYQVIRALKKNPETSDIPVIFVTAKIEDRDETLGFSLGAVDYIRKPVSAEITRARVKNHLELKDHRDRLRQKFAEKNREARTSKQRLIKREAENRSIREELAHTAAVSQKHQVYFTELFSNSPHGILLIDLNGNVLQANRSFSILTGLPAEEIMGNPVPEHITPGTCRKSLKELITAAIDGETKTLSTQCLHCLGTCTPVLALAYPVTIHGSVEGIFITFENISERKRYEEKLRHQAYHDPLTGVPNRSLLARKLDEAIGRRKAVKDYRFAVMLIDLDRFKSVNDTLGHQAGDRLLIAIARRIKSCLREQDIIARLGGDEFAILLDDVSGMPMVTGIAERIKEATNQPFEINGKEVHVSASTGIVFDTESYDCAQKILRDADFAMYHAKDSGKACFQIFHSDMQQKALHKLTMETELRHAITDGQLRLYYQPIIRMNNGRLQGFEALVRWDHPRQGIILPGQFIPIAEESDLIIPLEQWVVKTGLRQLSVWKKRIPETQNLSLNINISVKHFQQDSFIDDLLHAIKTENLSPSAVCLEFTETLLLKHSPGTEERINRLRRIGLGIAIDDFGTGYGSFSYLQQFSVSAIKIDRSFTQRINRTDGSLEIVKSLISLSHDLDLHVVAEGIETEKQRDALLNIGCICAQGFLFSPPLTAEEAEDWIKISEKSPHSANAASVTLCDCPARELKVSAMPGNG